MDAKLAVIALWARDVPAAARFYRDVLGLRLLPHHAQERPHFDLDGVFLVILPGEPPFPPPEPRFPLVTFSVPDLDPAVQELRRQGVDLPWGVEGNAAERWVMFRDPAGNLLELAEFKPA